MMNCNQVIYLDFHVGLGFPQEIRGEFVRGVTRQGEITRLRKEHVWKPGTWGMWHFRGAERGVQGRKEADKGFMEDEAQGEAGTRLSEPVTLYQGEILRFQEQRETITYRVHFKQGSDVIRVSCLKDYFGCSSSVVKGDLLLCLFSCFSNIFFLLLLYRILNMIFIDLF